MQLKYFLRHKWLDQMHSQVRALMLTVAKRHGGQEASGALGTVRVSVPTESASAPAARCLARSLRGIADGCRPHEPATHSQRKAPQQRASRRVSWKALSVEVRGRRPRRGQLPHIPPDSVTVRPPAPRVSGEDGNAERRDTTVSLF